MSTGFHFAEASISCTQLYVVFDKGDTQEGIAALDYFASL